MKINRFLKMTSGRGIAVASALGIVAGCGHSKKVSLEKSREYNEKLGLHLDLQNFGDMHVMRAGTFAEFATSNPPTTDDTSPFPEPPVRKFETSKNVLPCDDFYQYACSEEFKASPLKAGETKYAYSFQDADARSKARQFRYLSSLKVDEGSANGRMVAGYFQSCLNETGRLAEEKSLVESSLASLSGIDKNALVQRLNRGALSGLFSLLSVSWGSANQKNPSQKDVRIGAPSLFLSIKDVYTDQAVLTDYRALLEQFFTFVGGANPSEQANDVLAFEQKVAELSPTVQERRSAQTEKNYIERSELLAHSKNLALEQILAVIPQSVPLRAMHLKTIDGIDALVNTTDAETLRSYLAFRTIINGIKFSNPELEAARKALLKKAFGSGEAEASALKKCAVDAISMFPYSIDSAVLKTEFSKFPKERVLTILNNVKNQIQTSIEKNTWLSAAAREKAVLKISTMRYQVVAPDTLDKLPLEPLVAQDISTYIANRNAIVKARVEHEIASLELSIDDTKWFVNPLMVNAFYSPAQNRFVMPLGILQAPFFDEKASDVDNYGGMGAVVGHEIGHAIDNKGSKYDETGKLAPWMSEADLTEFNKRGSLLVEQFDTAGANGTLELGENIADLVGTTQSFKTIVGLGINSPEETKGFFLQWARVWCAVTTPEAIAGQIKTDTHAPHHLRVNEPLRQQTAFAQAFQCKTGSLMTLPAEKAVTIW